MKNLGRGTKMETGTVIDNHDPGRIRPEAGGGEVNFGAPSMRPPGSWPLVGDRVELERYAKFEGWAKVVRII
jgi:hypothetical protein